VLCLFAKEPLTITLKGSTFIFLFFLSFIIAVV
jgi:hypothetical protein